MARDKTIHASHGSSREAQSLGPSKKMSTDHVDRDGNLTLTSAQSREFKSNLQKRAIRATKFYHQDSMDQLGLDHHLQQLFFHIGWHQFLDLSARTYKQPTIEFLSTYARNDTARVLTFKLQGRQHRLKYKKLNKIMGTYDIYNSDIYSHQWSQFKSLPNVEFWTQITSLPKFNPSHQNDPFIMHPCWRIAHRILSTSIFARHEPGQINTVELYFLYCMSRHRWSLTDFTTFFLDKCDSLRTKTTCDICIGGLVTLIGLGMGLQFPASEYVPVDDPPLYLLDCITLMRMELILPHPNLLGHFSWLNHVKDPVYILPNPSLSTFTTNDPETWFLPQDLPDDDDAAADDDMQVDPDNADSPFEAEDHYDLPIRQLPLPHPAQASGSHFQPSREHSQPQYDYHSHQQPNEPDPAHEFPLDIYSQLASLRLQGNRNTATIHRIEEQQARTHTYMEDLWYHFRPEDGYPSRGPPPS
ncbi:unnamed protein product [Lactuca saligna]|uniref:Arabidopsis retrotransposon Orf1 C-terminal domain-containing protein n=1 Tax=Lactuca saligna TaxID=75948 RepID=A0AA35YD33_LACSI|nr:unnamed protein product [Lactuca saligna]